MATAVHAFRAACRERPLLPYEVLADADHWSPKARGEAAAVVGGVWRRSGFPGIELTTPLSWDDLCSSDRSWAFDLHSWDFLGQVLAGYSATRQGKMLDFALRLALDWATQYPTYEKPSERSFAWYDMAVGMRSYRLAYILDAAARSAAVDDDDINTLSGSSTPRS
jgi:hypothetical protein